ncbi:hypothetical protein B2G71_14225 [Novosphingobium sp. PC22D]|nr:hypothetical protein B2G71_14225 [Novosphingobium sp. PC22D]
MRILIEDYPLAWVCSVDGDEAAHLPLVGVFDAADRLTELIGHFAVSNPLGAAFAASPRATILFSGPSGYISPAYAGRRDWAATWNYANLRIEAEIAVEPALTEQALDLLADKMEAGAEMPWSPAELGGRYDSLRSRIVGFRASVCRLEGRFKLGQDERPDTLRSILANLPDGDLKAWMHRFNRDRLAGG